MKKYIITICILFSILFLNSCKDKTEEALLINLIKLVDNKDYPEAIKLADDGINKYPQNSNFYYYRGWCKLELSIKNAESDFRLCTKVDPNNPDGYKGLALVNIRNKKYKSAEKNFNYAISIASSDNQKASIYANKAYMNIITKKFTKAIVLYQKAIELNDIGDYYAGLGSAFYLNKKRIKAEEIWLSSLKNKKFKERKFKEEIIFKLSVYYFETEQYDKAKKYIDIVSNFDSKNLDYINMSRLIKTEIDKKLRNR